MKPYLLPALLSLPLCGCFSLFEDAPKCESVAELALEASAARVLAGETIAIFATWVDAPVGCLQDGSPEWSLVVQPQGAHGILEADPDLYGGRALTTDLPGTYRVRVELQGQRAELELEVVALQGPPPVAVALRGLVAPCDDAELHRGRLLCVDGGVSVRSARTGTVAWRTEEEVPLTYGLASGPGLFATAAVGCTTSADSLGRSRCKGREPQGGGLRVYRLGHNDRPELLSFTDLQAADDVQLDGRRAYITHLPGVLEVFDLGDPQHPTSLGCSARIEPGALWGYPLVLGERVVVVSDQSIHSYERSALERGCAQPAAPLSTLLIEPAFGRHAVLEHRGVVYLLARETLRSFTVGGQGEIEPRASLVMGGLSSMAIQGDWLYALDGRRLLALPLDDAGTLGPVHVVREDLEPIGPRLLLAEGGGLMLIADAPLR